MPTWTSERARVAGLTRRRPPDHPDLVEARRDLIAARLAQRIEDAVAAWPPLTAEQRAQLAILLLTANDEQRAPSGVGESVG
jgi:hypothetical protein